MKNENYRYAEEMLLKVSRTFALNINVLRGQLHKGILLAYLYLRIADTVEDDPILHANEKERLLKLFSAIFEQPKISTERLMAFLNALPSYWSTSEDPNHHLCVHATRVVPLLSDLDEKYAGPIRDVVVEMCSGMAKFALRQERSLAFGWFTLDKVEDLDEYCYYVAGIVGRLLTQHFYAAASGINDKRLAEMQKLDVSFGLALQITNIVKDVLEDSERKVCFIPESICKAHGFENSPALFEEYADRDARAAVLAELVKKAWTHVMEGVEYILLVPRRYMRIRLFCLWPLVMAAENLKAIGDGHIVFDSVGKVKISRQDVKRIITSTSRHFYSNRWIRKTFEDLKPC